MAKIYCSRYNNLIYYSQRKSPQVSEKWAKSTAADKVPKVTKIQI